MIIQPDYEREHEPSLIEDVVPPNEEKFTDVSREEVRRRPIGNLYRQYLRSRKKKEAPKLQYGEAGEEAVTPAEDAPKLRYTRVPPLQTLPSYPDMANAEAGTLFTAEELAYNRRSWSARLQDAASDTKNWTVQQTRQKGHGLVIAVAALFASISALLFGWLPKRYSADSGLVVDKRDKFLSVMRATIPLLLIALLFILKSWTTPTPEATNNPSSNANKTSSQASTPTNSQNENTSQKSSSPAGVSTPTASASSGGSGSTAISAPSGSSPQSSTSAPLVGGRGGGSALPPPPSTTTSPSGGLPLDTTLTIPPTSVQAGGKDIINTDGTTIHVN